MDTTYPSVLGWSSRCHEDGFGATSTWPSTGTVTSTSQPNGWVFLGGGWGWDLEDVGDGPIPKTNGYRYPKMTGGPWKSIFPFKRLKLPFFLAFYVRFLGCTFPETKQFSPEHFVGGTCPQKEATKIMRSKNHEISSHWWELEVQNWTLRKTESFTSLFRRVPADS